MSGSGSLTYTNPAVSENLSSCFAVDGPALGNLQIKDTKYVFDQFKVALGAYFEIDVFGLFDDRFDIPITDFDLSNLIPDISVPIHAGASPTTLNSSVTVQNVAPTAMIDLAGAEMIDGVNAFIGRVGMPLDLAGSSFDPGRDDLNLMWDFGDGPPVPDSSTDYLLAAATGPNAVTEVQSPVFDAACVNEVTFKATDSDGAMNQDQVSVVITGTADLARLGEFWEDQLEGLLEGLESEVSDDDDDDVVFNIATIECYLRITGFMSKTFSEVADASVIVRALHILDPDDDFDLVSSRFDDDDDDGTPRQQLDRQLLIAWLNFANGAFGFGEMVDVSGDGRPDVSFADAIYAAELVRLNPGARSAELRAQRDHVRTINRRDVVDDDDDDDDDRGNGFAFSRRGGR